MLDESSTSHAEFPSSTDVLVVGAGPAGCAAAITAARRGLKVVMIDKAGFPRDKCCGDGLTTLALRQLETLGFDRSSVQSWQDVDGAWLRSPSGREVHVPLPGHGFAAVATRMDLDAALVALATANGVRVIERCSFSSFHRDPADHEPVRVAHSPDDGVDVEVELLDESPGSATRRVHARWVVAADGMWSPVRKAAGFVDPGYRGEWHAFRQYARKVTGPAADRLIIWFEPDLLPGYAWSFPLPGNRANLGFGILRDGERRIQDMAGLWRDLLDRPHVRAALGPESELEGRHTAWPIPARVDRSPSGSGRILFVGDAVAACDVLTGEGIGQALLTGALAADSIVEGGSPREVRRRYRRHLDEHLRADHKMSAVLSRVLAHERGARGAISILDRSGDWARRNFARWMFEDEPRAIAVSPRRWHRHLFARPGAWSGRP